MHCPHFMRSAPSRAAVAPGRDAQPTTGGGAAPAAGGVVWRREGEVEPASDDDRQTAVESIDELGCVGPDEGRGTQRAWGGGRRRVEAQAPGVGDGAAAVTEAGRAGLRTKLGLHLAGGALDAATQPARGIADLRLHRSAEAAAHGGGEEGHGVVSGLGPFRRPGQATASRIRQRRAVWRPRGLQSTVEADPRPTFSPL